MDDAALLQASFAQQKTLCVITIKTYRGLIKLFDQKCTMTKHEMHEILNMRLAVFRSCSYAALAERVETDNRNHDCLEHIEGVGSDGTEYQLEFNAFWDDKPHGDIRVCGSLSAEPQRRLLGFLPIYTPDLTDSFIMSLDGSFVDEDEEKKIEQDAPSNGG